MIQYIDSHAHLTMLDFQTDTFIRLMNDWANQGLVSILDVGITAKDVQHRIALLEHCRAKSGSQTNLPRIYFSAGIWPSEEAIGDWKKHIDELEIQIKNVPRDTLVAIGECGLDRHWNHPERGSDLRCERELFAAQLDLACRYGLPVIVHSRDAAQETMEVLQDFPEVRGVIHCFSYGPQEITSFLEQGWYISFAGNVTYKNAQELREALQAADITQILLETDSPYLAPVPHRGKKANPSMVQYQYELASRIKNIPLEDLARQVARNFSTLFIQP
ncbi:TatD family hydrolase [Gracilinema caldarium]|uniref:TatD family hydrolase n=1 Tax=Gracilinema caldarium TaxID=215591 RepID=UPI0026F23103|nr:TatD family hydrolase [Gracilinema caldarium]